MRTWKNVTMAALATATLALPRLSPALDIVPLVPTGIEAAASGQAKLAILGSTRARFDLSVRRLEENADYDLVVDGIRVHTLRTNRAGRAKARFSTEASGGRVSPLGFDPRGASLELRDLDGRGVLEATLPGNAPEEVACCLPGSAACESRSDAECIAAGGTVSTAATCLPDPCAPPPPAEPTVACCLAADQCIASTRTECAAVGAIALDAATCEGDPCAPAPPPPSCEEACWSWFLGCLDGCTSTYCAPFCQVDLGRCLDFCPAQP